MKNIYLYISLIVFSLYSCQSDTSEKGNEVQNGNDSTQVVEKKWTNDDFVVTVREAANQPAPSLQSYCMGRSSQNEWLLIGGRTNGYHSLFGANRFFPSLYANDSISVVSLSENKTWKAALPTQYLYQLRVTNAAFHQQGNVLYIIGGYGAADSKDQNYQTFSTLTAVQVDELVEAIKAGEPNLEKYFSSLTDERLRVTGGELMNLNGNFYLVLGQNYQGKYSGNSGNYTCQIARFNIENQNNQLSITGYTTYTDPNTTAANSRFHRRDLNVLYGIRAGGRLGINVYGGVFSQQNDGAWQNPIYIDQDTQGNTSVAIDTVFSQKTAQYQTAALLMYSQKYDAMITNLMGGISLYKLENGSLIEDKNLPFINTITSIITNNSASATFELVQNPPAVLPALIGTSSLFVASPTVTKRSGTEIIDYDQLPAGQEVMVGNIYGGILATAPQSDAQRPTYANNKIYEVYVNKKVSANQ